MNRIGDPFIILPSVESTNIYAMTQVHARLASPGTAWFAREQTAGKGQRGKTWKASAGDNIILSVVVTPRALTPADIFQFSCMTALACYDLFKNYAGAQTSIKWPNDLYWGDRKAGGILIENIIQGDSWKNAVLGMGININQVEFDNDLPNPVSLKQITGDHYEAQALARELCDRLQERYESIRKGKFHDLLEEYNSALYKKDKETRLKKKETEFTAIVKKVSPLGQLIVFAGSEKQFEFGEIEWVV